PSPFPTRRSSDLRLSRSFHNSRNFAELTTNFVNHVHCSASNRLHRESREDNWNHTSDEKRSEHIGFKDVDSVDSCKRYVSGEKRKSCKCRRCNREAFSYRGCSVTYRVEDVSTLTYFFWKFTHFGNSTRIIRDRSESVDSKLHCSSCHHRRSGDRHSVESGQFVRSPNRNSEKKN